jgi:hypothetical protein
MGTPDTESAHPSAQGQIQGSKAEKSCAEGGQLDSCENIAAEILVFQKP